MISAGSRPVALEKAPGFAAVAKQTQSLTNARNESINRCAHLESYNVYFSEAAIGFACRTSGRRLWETSDGRRGGGGGKLVAGRATTRGRGATRAAALGAAALQAKRSRWRGIITGDRRGVMRVVHYEVILTSFVAPRMRQPRSFASQLNHLQDPRLSADACAESRGLVQGIVLF